MGFLDWLPGRAKKKEKGPPPVSETAMAIMAILDCSCEVVHTGGLSAEAIFTHYGTLLAEGRQVGFTPLFILPTETLLETLELQAEEDEKRGLTAEQARRAILELADKMDPAALMRQWYENLIASDDPDFKEADLIGEIGDGNPLHLFISISDFDTKAPYPELILARVPDTNPANLPAWVPMGGFNDCPPPEEQVAIFRYWYEYFGAVPAVVGYDTWECFVQNPPAAIRTALELAKQQTAFCSDIVFQGIETIGALADSLREAPVWFFWWD